MAYPLPIKGETADKLYEQAIFFWERYEEVKKERNEYMEALLDMLHQHGENWALSCNREACRLLNHPITTEPYDGKTCYCRQRKSERGSV